jgi:hypothetical protein
MIRAGVHGGTDFANSQPEDADVNEILFRPTAQEL